jgi:hypothetical protein
MIGAIGSQFSLVYLSIGVWIVGVIEFVKAGFFHDKSHEADHCFLDFRDYTRTRLAFYLDDYTKTAVATYTRSTSEQFPERFHCEDAMARRETGK